MSKVRKGLISECYAYLIAFKLIGWLLGFMVKGFNDY